MYRFSMQSGHECPYLPTQITQTVCYSGGAVTVETMNSPAMRAHILQKLKDALPHATNIVVGTFENVPQSMCGGSRRRLLDTHKGRQLEGNAISDIGRPTIIEGNMNDDDREIAASTIPEQANGVDAHVQTSSTVGDYSNAEASECITNPYAYNDCCQKLKTVYDKMHCCGRSSEICNTVLNSYDISCAWCCST